MSVEYKQFEALKSLADGAGIDYTLTQSTAGSRFVELCAQMITYFGATFTTSGGGIDFSKADYLYQLANAIGADPDASAGKTILVSAKAIYDESGATEAITGTSFNYRMYEYLYYATLSIPIYSKSIQILTNGLDDDGAFNDVKVPLEVTSPAVPVQSNCIRTNGAEWAITQDTPTESSAVFIKFKIDSGSLTTTRHIIGCGTSGNRFYFGTVGAGIWIVSWGASSAQGTSADAEEDRLYEGLMIGKKLYIDNQEVLDISASSFPSAQTQALWVGGQNNNGSLFAGSLAIYSEYKFRQSSSIDLVIFIGDSNATGQPDDFGDLPSDLQEEQAHYYAYRVDGTYDEIGQSLKPIDPTLWGPELTCISRMKSTTSKYYAVVKVTQSGSSLGSGWQKGGTEYNRLVAKVSAARSDLQDRGFTVDIKAVIGTIGANDAMYEDRSNNFAANWTQLISDVSSDSAIPSTVPVLIAGLQKDTTLSSAIYRDTVISQQQLLAAQDNFTLINTDNIPLGPDNRHWESDQIPALGYAYGDAYLSVIDSSVAEWDTDATMAEGLGNPYDRTNNANNIALNSSIWETDDDVYTANLSNGFYSSDGNAPFIPPSLLDPTIAANGLAITNLGTDTTNAFHNGAESKIRQTTTDAQMLNRGFWSADGLAMDDKSYDDIIAFRDANNGLDEVYFGPLMSDGVSIKNGATYDGTMTTDEKTKAGNFFGGTPV